ncbi:nuclear transport factor 2 family protein [Qipengyuania gelatinilytica]|uniref:Nuclear transport factor 2 family protein n=1 Tax=Qipengyuania gelatinilytica TaxID=2867231 RepID=A0ABX9A101_9SPHN|nr:nuclear transport factor 2 family protein [Qipengyuania gelatinilytica]QZD94928.1 nuclear transport factor 2 family protein [Qipengyuania gelatinilytica]
MFSSVFRFSSRKATRQQCIRDCVDSFNARNFDAAKACLTEDVKVCDANLREIRGRDNFLQFEAEISRRFPDRKLVVDEMHNHRGSVLVRGHFESRFEEVAGQALWQVEFDGNRISRVDVTRDQQRLTLPQFAVTAAA